MGVKNLKGKLLAIVGLVVGLYVAAELFPDALVSVTCSTSYAGAPSAVITLSTLVLGIVAVVALILIIIRR